MVFLQFRGKGKGFRVFSEIAQSLMVKNLIHDTKLFNSIAATKASNFSEQYGISECLQHSLSRPAFNKPRVFVVFMYDICLKGYLRYKIIFCYEVAFDV